MAPRRDHPSRRPIPLIPRLHLVTDDAILEAPGFLDRARDAIESGAGAMALHLRGPRASGRRLWELGRELLPAARAEAVTLLVNDRVDLAVGLGADGVQLGERGLSTAQARALLGPAALVGRSVHALVPAVSEARGTTSGVRGVDFLIAGAIFSTPSHPESPPLTPEGLSTIVRGVAEVAAVPVLGIGGIRSERVAAVRSVGAHGVAVMRAVWEAENTGSAVAALLESLRQTEQ